MQKATDLKQRDHLLRELLKNEYQRRAEKNPSFSLRALSAKLDMDQSLLSKMLQGKRKFSNETAQKIASFLGVPLKQLISNSETSETSYELLKDDEFFIISSWHHFAILELIKTKNFKPNTDYISKKLSITKMDAERALERLMRFGFIEKKRGAYLLKKPSNTWLNFNETTSARKNLQRQLHNKAAQAIEDIPFQLREHSSLTVAVDPKLLPEIKQKITEFRRSLDKFIEENGSQKEVYNLCVSFFPLSLDQNEK